MTLTRPATVWIYCCDPTNSFLRPSIKSSHRLSIRTASASAPFLSKQRRNKALSDRWVWINSPRVDRFSKKNASIPPPEGRRELETVSLVGRGKYFETVLPIYHTAWSSGCQRFPLLLFEAPLSFWAGLFWAVFWGSHLISQQDHIFCIAVYFS